MALFSIDVVCKLNVFKQLFVYVYDYVKFYMFFFLRMGGKY